MSGIEINEDRIVGELARGHIFQNYEWLFYESVGSTNDVARQRLQVNEKKTVIVCARQQTNGRGRGINRWVSNRPNNVYLSFGFPVKRNSFLHFSLMLADRITRCFREVFSVNLTIKAPNDLLLNGKKVGGILLEVPVEIDGWVLGIGINLFTDPDLQEQCAQPVGAIDSVKHLQPDAVILELCAIVSELEGEMWKTFFTKI
ncbi:MAG: biotin--[acetyl-CoA-carboxylase] ligase [Puniceicoccales bacterium]|jgi:BirA family biotin operon repressor/biotin-[acetyl-CoA-carboxylase] ligase|nr:biotin--[acetyl-CoA-carboxylase] ligase [Puniceicoccales bacterium]